MAFSSRLASNCASRSGSAATGAVRWRGDGTRVRPAIGGHLQHDLQTRSWPPPGRNPSAVVVTTSAASVGRREIDICRASSLVRSSRSPNEALQAARLRDDHVGRLPVVLDRSVLYRLGEAADGGERRAQVVRHGQQKVTLPGPAVLQALGHVVDGAGQAT